MFLVLRYLDGQHADALVLSIGRGVLRVAIPGRPDTLELRHARDGWFDEDGARISIDAIFAEPHQGGFQANTKYRAIAEIRNTIPAAIRSITGGLGNGI